MYFDPLYIVFMIPGVILSLLATLYVKSTFAKYAKVRNSTGLTGAQAAYQMLRAAGVNNVRIETTSGFLSDHYDPSSKTLRLSPETYGEDSIAAVGVACHEAGHALQHAQGYLWLGLRSALVPAVNIGSNFSYIVFFLGYLFQSTALLYVGCGLFALAVLFSIVTLPVEWDASARAKAVIHRSMLLNPRETSAAASVLNAAFMTYVASAVSSLLVLIYYILRAKASSRRR
ncbi:MAG: zinc metallopeptidase [Victivallales bacterium]|nr:zinc metallopeptidase [Victivallales bacterium]